MKHFLVKYRDGGMVNLTTCSSLRENVLEPNNSSLIWHSGNFSIVSVRCELLEHILVNGITGAYFEDEIEELIQAYV